MSQHQGGHSRFDGCVSRFYQEVPEADYTYLNDFLRIIFYCPMSLMGTIQASQVMLYFSYAHVNNTVLMFLNQ